MAAGDQMDVGMQDLLARRFAYIRAKIKSRDAWIEPFDLQAASQGNLVDGLAFLFTGRENIRDMPLGDYESVERLDGKLVANRKCQFIFRDRILRTQVTKYASILRHLGQILSSTPRWQRAPKYITGFIVWASASSARKV